MPQTRPDDKPLRYRPRNRTVMRALMESTGDGTSISVRDIAAVAGVHPSFIDKILRGEQDTVTSDVAAAWAAIQGCDLLVLWVPAQRTTTVRSSRTPAGSAVAR